MKILLILLCSTLISCTSLRISNFEYTKDATKLSFEELEYYNADAEKVAAILEALKE